MKSAVVCLLCVLAVVSTGCGISKATFDKEVEAKKNAEARATTAETRVAVIEAEKRLPMAKSPT